MSLEVRLGQRQEQRLALLPQMLQSIEVLQLATTDLLQFVEAELQQNETLELGAPPEVEPEAPIVSLADREDSGWEEWRRPSDAADDQKLGFLQNVPARKETLVDFVREQLAFRDLPALLADAVVQLAMHLDDRGLLPFPVAQIADQLGAPVALIEAALQVLQTLEPRGIGAADSVEAMLLQLGGDPDLQLIERLLREHLAALGRNKLPEVARAVALSIDELQSVMERIRMLNPRPGAEFQQHDDAPLRPDAFVWLHDGTVQVAVDDASLPDLQVNAEYAALAGDRGTAREVRDYLKPKLRMARDLIDAVQQRHATLLRVVQAVMEDQRQFLAKGPGAIRPLRMSDIADRLELHTSTVSRAIAGKFVQTDRGVFRLRDFFDGSRLEAAPAEGRGRMAVDQQIADLVDAEDKSAPLSDDDLVARLASRGVRAARRTVTKYRQQLGIPSSYLRRRYGGS